MKTLIELYDERPLDNVLATEMFHPEETIFVCPPEIARNKTLHATLKRYFELRGCLPKLTFVPVSLLDAVAVEKKLREVLETHEDCVIDISGGTDAALFAAGAVSRDTAVITYSRGKNAFFEIQNAPYARNLPCSVRLDAAACLMMAGGELLQGREDNRELRGRQEQIDRLFSVYRQHRRQWNDQIAYIQRISSVEELKAEGTLAGKANNRQVRLDVDLLRDLAEQCLIEELRLEGERVSFRFPDETVRFWLRDMGSVLELQVYRACLEAGDTILSAVVNWRSDDPGGQAVTNEIDVMCVRGVTPLFISCKTCEIKTEALNELAILRDRFGGKASRAAIVTSASATRSRRGMLKRAAGEVDAVETEIGYEPKPEDINIEGLDITLDTVKELLSVDKEAWLEDCKSIREFFAQIGDHVPQEMYDELDKLEKNLRK